MALTEQGQVFGFVISLPQNSCYLHNEHFRISGNPGAERGRAGRHSAALGDSRSLQSHFDMQVRLGQRSSGTSGTATIGIGKSRLWASEADNPLCPQSPGYARCTVVGTPLPGKLGPAHSSSRHQDAIQAAAVQEGGFAALPRPDRSPPAETQPQCQSAGKSPVCINTSTSPAPHILCAAGILLSAHIVMMPSNVM